MRVLIACEYSGTVRDAFVARGHEAMSCDMLPTDKPNWTYDPHTDLRTHHPDRGQHYRGDVLDLLDHDWDLMIAHPPCTYLCSSGLHWNTKIAGRADKTLAAAEFVTKLWESGIPRICIENPVGCLPRFIGPAAQWIQPHQFGHDASKKTGLWLRGLPPLRGTLDVSPRMIDGRPRWANQTDSGQNRLSPSEDRWKLRSTTYQGIADAMADQWGAPI